MKNVIKWLAAAILILGGLGLLVSPKPAAGVFYLIAGALCVPAVMPWLQTKLSAKFHTWQKYAMVIIPLGIGGALMPPSPSSSANTTASAGKTEAAPVETFNKIGDQVRAGDFTYVVDEIQWQKEIGNEFTKTKADGIYLLVALRVINGGKETKMLDNSMFKLTGKNNVTFETSTNAITAVELSGGKSLFLKQCQPGIASSGILAFEVPEKGEYDLHLSSGFWNTNTAVVKLK